MEVQQSNFRLKWMKRIRSETTFFICYIVFYEYGKIGRNELK